MAKQTITATQQQKFDKTHFQPGANVIFTWLGSKKYGYVKAIKKTNWGIQYMVESEGTRYPCGIEIAGIRTSYHIGCIYYEQSKSGASSRNTEVVEDAGGSTICDRIQNTICNPIHTETQSNVRNSKSELGHENGVESGNDVNPTSTRKQPRRVKKLDDAIAKQRDFLNGFVKPA